MFQTTPASNTSRISVLSSGLLEKAVSSAPDSKAATTSTAARKTSMRMR